MQKHSMIKSDVSQLSQPRSFGGIQCHYKMLWQHCKMCIYVRLKLTVSQSSLLWLIIDITSKDDTLNTGVFITVKFVVVVHLNTK